MKAWIKAYWMYFKATFIVGVASIAPPFLTMVFNCLWILLSWFILIPLAFVILSKMK